MSINGPKTPIVLHENQDGMLFHQRGKITGETTQYDFICHENPELLADVLAEKSVRARTYDRNYERFADHEPRPLAA